jgi:predicted esterase
MTKTLLTLVTAFTILNVQAQNYDETRYLSTTIFPTTSTTNNVQYGSAPQWIWPYWNEDLYLNVTQPVGDLNTRRPLIVFAHAGGFLNGSKDVDDMVAICDSFARMGFVTATIDYRKGFNPLDAQSAERAVYRGLQDGKTAVRFFKTNASTYNIDTNYVFFGGMSAGGFTALNMAYLDKESERPSSTYGGGTVNDLGCLDCGDHPGVSSKVRGVLDYWGAVNDTLIIESSTDTPVLIMHGENDPTVPFGYGYAFGLTTLPPTFGGLYINDRCNNLGVNHSYVTSSGPLHMLDGSNNGDWSGSPNAFWGDTLLPETTTFIYNLIKPNTAIASPQNQLVCSGSLVTFEVTNDHADSYFVWDYDTSNINLISSNSNEKILQLEFNTVGTYQVKVVEFNEILCAGDTLSFNITIAPEPVANFSYLDNLLEVSFTNTSSNGAVYAWDFGDGNTSTDENPTHTYAQDGTYIVTLTTTSADGCVNTYTQTITVYSVGIFEYNNALTVNNPFMDEIIITADFNFEIVKIYNVNGQIMFQSNNNTNAININTQTWRSGLYILEYTNTNQTTDKVKLIKL